MTPFVWLWLFIAGCMLFELSMNFLVLPLEREVQRGRGNQTAYVLSGSVSVLGLDLAVIGLIKAWDYAHSLIKGVKTEREV